MQVLTSISDCRVSSRLVCFSALARDSWSWACNSLNWSDPTTSTSSPRPIKALNLSSSHCNESHSEREITISSDTEFPEVTELLFIRLISLEFWSDVEFRLWVERTNFCSSVKTKVTRPSSEKRVHQNIWIKFRNQNL